MKKAVGQSRRALRRPKHSKVPSANVRAALLAACVATVALMCFFYSNPPAAALDAQPAGGARVGDADRKEDHAGGSGVADWCHTVEEARGGLDPSLAITYPCRGMAPAVSAVVCMLTGSADASRANKILFTARDYIDGAMALGTTLLENTDHAKTHRLLLLREGFELAPDDKIRLESAGWTLGTAPEFKLDKKYVPTYERYTTTYTKVTALGLAEYQCVLLMDADTLVVGDIRELMTCNKFQQPQQRVAGTLDLDRGKWHGMNTGALLWRPDAQEMNRVFRLTKDASFMKRFSSDQDFLNHVYPERFDRAQNNRRIDGTLTAADKEADAARGAVVDLGWEHNAQTHVEAERVEFWEARLPAVRILHFTRRKGWQCAERHGPPPPLEEMPKTCHLEKGGLRGGTQAPICYCREADKYWNALERARERAAPRLAAAKR